MAWHNENRTMRMPNHILSGAAEQDMLEAGRSMCRSHDNIRATVFGAIADLLPSMPDLQRRLHFDSVPVCFFNQIPHLITGGLFGVLGEQWKVVARVLITRDVILERDRVQQNKF